MGSKKWRGRGSTPKLRESLATLKGWLEGFGGPGVGVWLLMAVSEEDGIFSRSTALTQSAGGLVLAGDAQHLRFRGQEHRRGSSPIQGAPAAQI